MASSPASSTGLWEPRAEARHASSRLACANQDLCEGPFSSEIGSGPTMQPCRSAPGERPSRARPEPAVGSGSGPGLVFMQSALVCQPDLARFGERVRHAPSVLHPEGDGAWATDVLTRSNTRMNLAGVQAIPEVRGATTAGPCPSISEAQLLRRPRL